VLAATFAHAVGRLDEVWILPVARHAYGKPISAWERRWALCQAAFAGLGFARLRDDELRNPEGYTWTLIQRLRVEHPTVRWALVGGTDTSRDVLNWHRGAELTAQVDIIAVPRRGFDEADPAALPAISSSLVRGILARGEDARGLLPAGVADRIAAEAWYR